MSLQYATGSKVNTTTVVNDKASLCAVIDTGLTAAGWTVTTHTSSTDNIYQSGVTPQSNQIKIRVWDGGGQCVRIKMMNTAQTISQSDSCYLYATTSTSYTIIANQFQFVIFVPGSVSSRNFCIGSAFYIPPNLVTMGLTTAAFIQGNATSDTDTTNLTGSFRTALTIRGFAGAAPGNGWTILNATSVEYSGLSADSFQHPGLLVLAMIQSAAMDSISGYRWHDDSAFIFEPLVAWGTPTIDSEAKLRGQLWDAFVVTESFPADITTSVDSHNYYNLTESNDGHLTLPASMRGSLFVLTA
jgi:hypothetical protein